MATSSSTAISGDVNLNDDEPGGNPWLIGGGLAALVFVIWLLNRKK